MEEDSTHEQGLFGMIGWLFADLLLALAMIFLVGNTVGRMSPPPQALLRPSPTPTPATLPVLELHPVTLMLTVDYQRFLAGDPLTTIQVERQIESDPRLTGKRAGLVLTFGGAQGDQRALANQIAEKIDTTVLPDLGRKGFVFYGTVYREFLNLDNSPSTIQLDIYVFK